MAIAALTGDEVLGRTLLAVAVVVALTRALAPVLRRLGQPAVLAQVLAGLLLGPAVLGGGATDWLFAPEVRTGLAALGNAGLVLFLFLMGLELDLPSVRAGGRRLAAVSAGSLALPFVLGVLAALTVLDGRAPGGVGTVAFVAFVGTALSVSALPVLAGILDERELTRSPIGQLVLSSAALQDAAAWVLLALSLALAGGAASDLGVAVGGAVVLAALLLGVVRPVLAGPWGARLEDGDGAAVGLLAAALLACAALTQLAGLHAALGALAFGAAFPRSRLGAVHGGLERAVGPLVRGVLLPVFFLLPGLRFSLDALGGSSVGVVAVLLACATAGKLLGAGLPALATGSPPRTAAAVGVLLNTRGLVELIVLEVGRSNGVIDAGLASELTVVALATTFATGPLLRLVGSDARLRRLQPQKAISSRAAPTGSS